MSARPIFKPPPRLPDNLWPESSKTNTVTKTNIDVDFEENSPHQEGIISELYQRPDKTYFQEPKDLESLVNTRNLVQKFLPKQADIDKILKIIQCKVLKGLHLSVTVKEIQPGYLNSLYFKEIYLYLAHNKLPSSKVGIRKVEALAEKYILLDSLLFKISTTSDKEMAVLAIPETCVHSIIVLYHSSLFAGHQGVIKTYLTISDKFFIPNLFHYLRSYIKGYHICQLTRNEKPPSRQMQTRINLNYRPLSKLSMDLKVMPKSNKGHKFILCIIDEVTNYLITVPIYQPKAEEVGEALIEHVITKYCIPDCIIMDQDRSFMSSIMNYLFSKFNIKIKTVAPYNHQSLQAEHGIKSLSTILTKHLTKLGQMWPKYMSLATFTYNMFNTPNLANYSLYELVFGRKPKILLNLETTPDIKVSGSFKEYHNLLNKRLKYLHKIIQNFKSKRLAMINKDRMFFQYNSGDLAHIISPLTSQLWTASRKVMIKYVRPVVKYKIIDLHNYLLKTVDGKILWGLFKHERLKPVTLRTSEGNVNNLAKLKQIINVGLALSP